MKFTARAVALVVCAQAFAPGALAYIGGANCFFDEGGDAEEEFDFCVFRQTGQIDNNFYWNYNEVDGTLDVLLDASTPYWQAFGFSPQTATGVDVGMGMSSVVMGCADFIDQTDTVNSNYFLSAKALSGVTVADEAAEMLSLTSYSWEEVDGRCIVRFTRPFSTTDLATGLWVNGADDPVQRVVMARGEGNTLAQHGSDISQRVFFDVNFATGEISIEGNTALEDVTEDDTDDDGTVDDDGAAAAAAPLAVVSFATALFARYML